MGTDDKSTLLTQLLPSIATQMRAALGNIHLAAGFLAPADVREKNPELDQRAAMLDQAYYQLLRLVDNFTTAAYLTDEILPPMQNHDIVDLVRDVCERSESLAQLLGISLTFTCAERSRICLISRDSMEQLLFQLLSNAFKFTPAGGGVAVDLKFLSGQVVLAVSDSGCGISEELMHTLFDRYRHKDLVNPPPHGLGLGLPLCRKIAENHGGSIMAESKAGTGTRVTVSIPLRVGGNMPVSDVPFDYAGGFNRTLLALADALPTEAFRAKNQD